MKTLVMSMAIVMGMTAGTVVAAEKAAEPSYEQKFTWYDKNKDGSINKQEASIRTDFTEQWSKLDTDKSGQVDLAEFSAYEEANKPDTGGE